MMKSYEMKSARQVGITLLPEATDRGWCEKATEIAAFLDALAENVPAWKFWIRPGLRLAAEVIRRLRDMKCGP